MLEEREAEAQTRQALSENEKNAIAFRTLFLMFGKLAKTDSHVSQEEIDSIKTVMTNAELDQEAQKVAIEFFKKVKRRKRHFGKSLPNLHNMQKMSKYVEMLCIVSCKSLLPMACCT